MEYVPIWLREEREKGIKIGEKRGVEIAEKRGVERGVKIGEKRGEERGVEIGEKRGKIKTAKRMLEDGLPIETVSKYTGLNENEIKRLKKSNRAH